MVRTPGAVRGWAVLLMAASGFAGLGLQIVWTQQSASWLGHETAAILAVVAAFFGGIGTGSLWLARRIDASRHPGRWYAVCEGTIAVWGLALTFIMAPAARFTLDLLGLQPAPAWNWLVVFCGTFLLLLPATAAMGATLPAMERLLAGLETRGTPIAALYAANTAGAVAGVLGTAFLLIPTLGLAATTLVCVLTNASCAVIAWRALGSVPSAAVALPVARAARGSLVVLAVTGFLGIGYEVLVVRVLSQLTENTVYTFAILLAVYLVGTALGAAVYARWSRRRRDMAQTRDRLLQLLSAACLFGVVALACAGALNRTLLPSSARMGAALALEALLAVAAFAPATLVMGALFSHLASSARAAGLSFGRALGANTLAAALAPLSFGVALPRIGSTFALLAIAGGYLLLAARGAWRSSAQLAGAAAVVALALWSPVLGRVDVPQGGRLLSRVEGTGATVSVVEDAAGIATLHINNRQQEGSSATWFADARQAALPLLLHPAPRTALFLGVGTGVTAHAATDDPQLEVDAVELLPEVIDAMPFFMTNDAAAGARLHVYVADARRFVRAASRQYDVIVADNFHPARSGSASLYTVEHFAAVRARLARDGIFCQWLPLHQLDLATLRSIVRSFTHVYPRSWALLATHSLDTPVVGLVARRDGGRFESAPHTTRAMPSRTALGLTDELAIFGSFVAGPDALARFGATAPLNTDDHPVVAYLAPRLTYAADSAPRARLLALLREVAVAPGDVFADAEPRWSQRLATYWKARDLYLEVGSSVRMTAGVDAMLAQVRVPLLAVLDVSADFRPAYDPLLRMATALAEHDAPAARELLARLAQLQPDRQDTRDALRALDAAH